MISILLFFILGSVNEYFIKDFSQIIFFIFFLIIFLAVFLKFFLNYNKLTDNTEKPDNKDFTWVNLIDVCIVLSIVFLFFSNSLTSLFSIDWNNIYNNIKSPESKALIQKNDNELNNTNNPTHNQKPTEELLDKNQKIENESNKNTKLSDEEKEEMDMKVKVKNLRIQAINNIFLYTLLLIIFFSYLFAQKQNFISEVLGLAKDRIFDIILFSFICFLAITPIIYSLRIVSVYYLWFNIDYQQVIKLLAQNTDVIYRLLIAFMACVMAPIFEELVFRGYIFPVLAKFMGKWFSIIITSLFFSLVHFNVPSLISLFILAIFLNLIFINKRNILYPIFIHAFFNSMVFVILFIKDLIY